MISLCKGGFILVKKIWLLLAVFFLFLILFITPFITAEQTSQTNLTNGLALWYHMNNQSEYGESATNVYDFAGGNNNGTYTSAATPRLHPADAGRFKGGFSFAANTANY